MINNKGLVAGRRISVFGCIVLGVFSGLYAQQTTPRINPMGDLVHTEGGAIRVDGATRTGVDYAQNGVPVVNIAAPSGAGVSSNSFTDFNVGPNGVIMNNSNTFATSVLGGALYGNPNLGSNEQEARIILNQVTGTGGSNLFGATEIHGRPAEYLLANPNGITCDGCGFINTPNASLITGNARVEGGAIMGFDMSKAGRIQINGKGLNAWDGDNSNRVNHLALITRAAKIYAEIHANRLSIKTGNDYYDYQSKEMRSKESDGSVAVSISVSALAGMYGNQITLESTELGVGVNSQGHIGSDLDHLVISAEGDIFYNSLSAARGQVRVTSAQGSITQGGYAASGGDLTLSAATRVTLSGTAPEALEGNSLYSGGHMTIGTTSESDGAVQIRKGVNLSAGGALNIIASGAVAGEGVLKSGGYLQVRGRSLQQGGQFFSGGNMLVTLTEDLLNRGTLASQGQLIISGQKIVNEKGGTLFSRQHTLLNALQGVINRGHLTGHERLTIHGESFGNEAGGALFTEGNAAMTLTEGFTNGGDITTGGALALKAKTFLNQAGGRLFTQGGLTMTLTEGFTNGGHITTKDTLALAAKNFNNQAGGALFTEGNAAMTLTEGFTNGGDITTGGALALAAKNFNNQAEGQLSTQGDAQLTVAEGITNAGTMATAKNLTAGAKDFINARGEVITGGLATFAVENALDNEGGTIDTKGDVAMSAHRLLTNAASKLVTGGRAGIALSSDYNITGVVSTGGDFTLETPGAVVNRTDVTVGGTATITSGGDFTNGVLTNPTAERRLQETALAKINAAEGIYVKAPNIINYGVMATGGGLLLQAERMIGNRSALNTGGGDRSINRALMFSQGAMTLYGEVIENFGGVMESGGARPEPIHADNAGRPRDDLCRL